jgi:hypothetical protein
MYIKCIVVNFRNIGVDEVRQKYWNKDTKQGKEIKYWSPQTFEGNIHIANSISTSSPFADSLANYFTPDGSLICEKDNN